MIPFDAFAAASVVLLFLPSVPLLFMGQDWAASAPFRYFTDHHAELGAAITRGRREEFKGFSHFANAAMREKIPDPQAEATFESSRIAWAEASLPENASILALYAKLLQLRREDPVLSASTSFPQAEAQGDLLVARRVHEGRERVLVFNAGDTPLEAPLRGYDVLVASAPLLREGALLAPKAAAILARR
jgi:maltooligosyltrehalose trehalohydrolase